MLNANIDSASYKRSKEFITKGAFDWSNLAFDWLDPDPDPLDRDLVNPATEPVCQACGSRRHNVSTSVPVGIDQIGPFFFFCQFGKSPGSLNTHIRLQNQESGNSAFEPDVA